MRSIRNYLASIMDQYPGFAMANYIGTISQFVKEEAKVDASQAETLKRHIDEVQARINVDRNDSSASIADAINLAAALSKCCC